MDFFKQYNKWLEDCQKELSKRELPWGFEFKEADICEDGQVYFGSGRITYAGFVTPWHESPHYVK